MKLTGLELRRVAMPLVAPFRAFDTRLELHIPIGGSGHNQLDLTIKHLPARRYACMEASPSSARPPC